MIGRPSGAELRCTRVAHQDRPATRYMQWGFRPFTGARLETTAGSYCEECAEGIRQHAEVMLRDEEYEGAEEAARHEETSADGS